jgi:hypothetical protein
MSLNHCTSDPTAGCGDGANLISEIRTGNNRVVEKLTDIDSKVSDLITATEECCEETNDNLTGIKDRLDTLISNAAECCEAITDRLDIIAGLLQNVVIAPSITQWRAGFSNHVCEQTNE